MPFCNVEHLIHKATKYYVKEVQQQILRFRHTATAVNVGLQRCAKHHYAVMHIVECLKHILVKKHRIYVVQKNYLQLRMLWSLTF